MNREDIIKLAREAGLDPDLWNYTDAFERFAALVAEHERKALCEKRREAWLDWCSDPNPDFAAAIRARYEAEYTRGDR